jgi:hypothetical protein
MASAYPVTMHGLNEWHKAMFEKLGWMVLAKSRATPHTDAKIKNYIDGVDSLIASINKKIGETKDADRIADLKVLLANTTILQSHVKKDFGTTGGKKNNKKNNDNNDKK